MKILAIDSSGLVASAAVLEDRFLLAEYTVNYKLTHSQTLMPMIDEILSMLHLKPDDLDLIAAAGGPGSFTGLRIGTATAKGLGLALNKPLVHIPTVDGLACNLWGVSSLICPLMDARRNQVYTGLYRFRQDNMQTDGQRNNCQLFVEKEQCAVSIDEIVIELNGRKEEVVFLGDGVPVYEENIKQLAEFPYTIAPSHIGRQRAGAVGMLAFDYADKGKILTAGEFRPEYLRLSQAERELEEKKAAQSGR